jgi:hypothetical protein
MHPIFENVDLGSDREVFGALDGVARTEANNCRHPHRDGITVRLQHMEGALIAAIEVMSPAQRRMMLENRSKYIVGGY